MVDLDYPGGAWQKLPDCTGHAVDARFSCTDGRVFAPALLDPDAARALRAAGKVIVEGDATKLTALSSLLSTPRLPPASPLTAKSRQAA
jgi:hypothetical protein